MKKYLQIGFLVMIISPSIALASWWNPISWFNNWSFDKKEKIQQVEKVKQVEQEKTSEEKINELQKQLDELKNKQKDSIYIEQKTELYKAKDNLKKEKTEISTTKKNLSLPSNSIIETNTLQNNSSVRCKILNKGSIKIGDTVRAELYDLNIGISKYNIVWDTTNLSKLTSFNEASFVFDTFGSKIISAIVTKKDDNIKTKISCPGIIIPCESFSCLSEKEKKAYKLQSIIDEVDRWYNNEYSNLLPEDRCSISESVIRAFEYEYTLMGGINIPAFSKNVDCANSVAPKAYRYKIQVLKNTL